jgi:hypothetical protein
MLFMRHCIESLGTVLGRVLFSLHIHDILDNISSDIRLFADDCVCYRVIDSTEDCKILQNDIDEMFLLWC